MPSRISRPAKPHEGIAPSLADKPLAEPRATGDACYRYTLTSGLFGLPAGAQAVDWMVVNNSPVQQTFRLTVYKAGVGAKTAVAPGPLTLTLTCEDCTHNANGVGIGKPFVPGFYYEVVLEADDRAVLPSVHVWQDRANTVIAGTLIPSGAFVRL